MPELDSKYSIALLSWGAVGKSALVHRFLFQQFADLWGFFLLFDYKQKQKQTLKQTNKQNKTKQNKKDPTIEDKYQRAIDVDGQEVLLDILDTNGHEEYVALMDGWIRGSQGFLLVYDIGRRGSFEQIE